MGKGQRKFSIQIRGDVFLFIATTVPVKPREFQFSLPAFIHPSEPRDGIALEFKSHFSLCMQCFGICRALSGRPLNQSFYFLSWHISGSTSWVLSLPPSPWRGCDGISSTLMALPCSCPCRLLHLEIKFRSLSISFLWGEILPAKILSLEHS